MIGHDIGGGTAQHLAVHAADRVSALGLVNAVVLDSWPVPAVEKFQDPDVRSATGPAELLESRRQSMDAVTQRELTAEEVEDYLSPWHSPERVRSFMAMAAAADARYTLDLVQRPTSPGLPTLLVWGEQDSFQKIEYAEELVKQVPNSRLDRVPGRHLPQEDSPEQMGSLLPGFVASVSATKS